MAMSFKYKNIKQHFVTLFFCILGVISQSCDTTKELVYFQGDTTRYKSLERLKLKNYTIKNGDILAISVTSLDEETNKMFELSLVNGVRYTAFPGVQSSSQGFQPLGYKIDEKGMIEMPLIGKVSLKDLSIYNATDTLRNKLAVYLKSPSVNIRVVNHSFTIIGEVNRPATYNILDEKLSLPEALGLAGDLTIYGRRDNILLIRVDEEGNREKVRLNILDANFLNSEYYYLKNNDIIYVEPSKVKSTYNDRTYQVLPIVTSIVSAVTSLGVLIISLTR